MTGRALRVGLLLGGNLVEERVFAASGSITFGQSLRCTLSLPSDGLPREHVLFATDQGQLRLRVTEQFRGRIAAGDQIQTDLQQGAADAGVWTIPIARGTRGKLHIGDATILFQEIAAAPVSPRPVLPASIRGTLGDRIDRRLAVIIGASVVAHLGLAAYAWINDVDTGSMLETPVAQHYRQEVMEVTLPDEPTTPMPPTPDTGPGAATPVSPAQTARPIVKRPQVATQTPARTPGMLEDDAQRFASILTGTEVGRTGANDLTARQPGADLQKQLDAVGDRRVVVGNETGGFRKQPREGIGTTDGPNIDNPTQVANEPKGGEREPTGRIQIKPLPPEGEGTTLTVQAVLDKIKGVYMSGLQRCYKKGLLDDSKLSGKVSMSFTVSERGALEDASARGVSSEVDACISSFMSGWRFAIPRDKDGDATDASFKLALALQPS